MKNKVVIGLVILVIIGGLLFFTRTPLLHEETSFEKYSDTYKMTMDFLYDVTDKIIEDEKIQLTGAELVHEEDSHIVFSLWQVDGVKADKLIKGYFDEIGYRYPYKILEQALPDTLMSSDYVIENIDFETKRLLITHHLRTDLDTFRYTMLFAFDDLTMIGDKNLNTLKLSDLKEGMKVQALVNDPANKTSQLPFVLDSIKVMSRQ